MKIIILTSNYPRKDAMMNGFFIHQQVKALCEIGAECHVILTHNWYPPFGLHRLHPYWRFGYKLKQSFLSIHEDVRIHHVPVKIKIPSRFFPEDFYEREASSISKYISKRRELRNADWMYAHFLTDYGYIGSIIRDQLNIRLAAIARGDDVHAWPEENPKLVCNLHRLFRKADVLLANSKKLSLDVKKWFEKGFVKDVLTIYNGIDDKRYTPLALPENMEVLRRQFGLPANKKLLLCVAAPVEMKGWIELLDAICDINDSLEEWKLVAVTPSRTYFKAIDLSKEVQKRGIQNRFVLLGQIDTDRMPDCYRSMDAFVLPSHNEGLSNAVLEAMASGLAVITTDVGGHSEFIVNNENGILVPPRDKESLAAAILKIVTDDKFRIKISSQARKGALTLGSYEINALRIKELLESIEFKS